jgi:hypothetical protein
MGILIVTFELEGLDDATYRLQCEQVAPAFRQVPGLIAKTWLADPATNTYGGIYHFASREAIDGYLASALVRGLKTNPRYVNLTTRIFGTLDGPSQITRGPLPFEAAA